MNLNKEGYGIGDASFKAAGGQEGVERLVDCFYDYMETLPEAQKIRSMHPEDLSESRLRLSYFLCGWMGGPRLYLQHFGQINIPKIHGHLNVSEKEKQAWLMCMNLALQDQPYTPEFKQYLLEALAVPAERIQSFCESRQS